MRISLFIAALAVSAMSFGQGLMAALPANEPIGHHYISLSGEPLPEYGPELRYSNTTLSNYYLPNASYGDDLFMVPGHWLINGFEFAYFDPSGGTGLTRLDVLFHRLDTGTQIAGYTLTGLLGDGAWIITVSLVGGFEFVAPHDYILMSLMFRESDSPSAGWLTAHPPAVGTSQDMFWVWTPPPSGWYWFGGRPPGNFYAKLYAVPEPGTIAALAVGLVGLLGLRRRK